MANRKHLNEIVRSFRIRLKCDKLNLEADNTSYVNIVTQIEIFVRNVAFVLNNKHTYVHNI